MEQRRSVASQQMGKQCLQEVAGEQRLPGLSLVVGGRGGEGGAREGAAEAVGGEEVTRNRVRPEFFRVDFPRTIPINPFLPAVIAR